MNKELPVYEARIDPNREEHGLEFVSLVAEPAIQEMGLAFKAMESRMQFAEDRDKQIIIGPAMIPDIPLYRDQEGKQFYVVFTKEVIEQLHEKFAKEPREYKVNVDHNKVVKSAFIKSSWIIEDEVHDKSRKYGLDMPVGTLMMEVKIEDPEFWASEVRENAKYGFSVEGLFELQLAGTIDKYQNKNKNEMKEKFNAKVMLADLTPEEIAELQSAIAEVAPAEIVEEVTEAVVEVVEEQMEEGTAEVEAGKEEEVKAEEEMPAAAPAEDAVMAVVTPMIEALQAQIEELAAQVAEMRASAPVEEAVAMSAQHADTHVAFIKHYNQKWNG
jgi:hypothetical protein